MTNHKEHKFEFVKVAASDTKKKLLEEIVPLRELVSEMTQAMEKVHSTKQEVEAEGKSVTDTILASFNELQQMLNKGKLQLLQEASSIVQQKLEKLAAQGEKLSQASASVQSIINYTERLVDHCSDNEVMSMHTEIREKVVQRIESTMKPKTTQKQEDNAGGVSSLKPPEQVGQKFGSIAWDVSQCTVRGEGLNVGTVDEVSSLVLSTNQNYDISSHYMIVGKFVSWYDSSFVYCYINQSGLGEYLIQYTPKVRGRHDLSVLMDGQHIPGSPFSVMVSIPPSQLGKPVKKLQISCICKGIVVNSRGELIVVTNKDIVVIGQNGEIQRTLVHFSSSKCSTYSISIDKSDVIYCARGKELLRSNQQGVFYVKQMDISCTALTVVGDEVMTCNESDTITVYGLDLNYVRSIEYRGMGHFREISSDSQGNLYVASGRNNIAVFSNGGNYLRSFCVGSDNFQRLCVSGQCVYVTCPRKRTTYEKIISMSGSRIVTKDKYEVYVYVLTTAGKYTDSIGYDIKFPAFVHVDKDEFVWVADEEHVQVF